MNWSLAKFKVKIARYILKIIVNGEKNFVPRYQGITISCIVYFVKGFAVYRRSLRERSEQNELAHLSTAIYSISINFFNTILCNVKNGGELCPL